VQGQPEAALVVGFRGEGIETGIACYDCTASGKLYISSIQGVGRDYI
jgi:hypothetical protein